VTGQRTSSPPAHRSRKASSALAGRQSTGDSNQFGNHLILNNIRRGDGLDRNTFARVLACTGFNGTGDCRALSDPDVNIVNLTPINSIVVAPRRASGQEPR